MLHDATFEKSNPFFHAANLLHLLRQQSAKASLPSSDGSDDFDFNFGHETLFLSLQTDGGADHNERHLKVKLSLLALKRCLGVKRLDSQRCAPNNSATLVHERIFSLLNLGLQHTSFARPEMEPDLEHMVQHLSSMSAIRHAAGTGPAPKKPKEKAESTAARIRAHLEDEADEEKDDDDYYIIEHITAIRTRRGGEKELLVKWAPPPDSWVAWPEPSWVLLAKVAASAPEKLREFRLSRDAEGLAAEEAAAAAVKEKEGSTAAAAEAAKAAIVEKQQRLREGWQKAIQAVIASVKERLEQLELKGIRVECPPVAPAEVLAELHASLHSLDACYDEKYNLNSDLPKMPVIH